MRGPPGGPTAGSSDTSRVHTVTDVDQSGAASSESSNLSENLVRTLSRPTALALSLGGAHWFPLRNRLRRSVKIFCARSARVCSRWKRATAIAVPVKTINVPTKTAAKTTTQEPEAPRIRRISGTRPSERRAGRA